VKIHGREVRIRARIESMENLSAHADCGEILGWLAKFPKVPQKTFLVHGELSGAEALKEKITQQLGWNVSVASYLERVLL
jgi:metallo-beta-lactamase family protein